METDYILHVGMILKDHLDNLNISQKELSEKTGISKTIINEIIKGKRGINADYAMKFEEVFQTPAKVWLDIQNDYELAIKNNSKSIYVTASKDELINLNYDANTIADRILFYENEEIKNNPYYTRSITPLKLQKLLYFIQKEFIKINNVLFKDDIFKWEYGPVIKSVYNRFKNIKDPIDLNIDDNPLPSSIEKIIFNQYKKYQKYTASYLVTLTHQEKSFLNTNYNQIITPICIQNYL